MTTVVRGQDGTSQKAFECVEEGDMSWIQYLAPDTITYAETVVITNT